MNPWRRLLFLGFTEKGGDETKKTLQNGMVIWAFLLAEM